MSNLYVVAVVELGFERVEFVIENHRGALLALEFNAEISLTSVKQFNLNDCLLPNLNSILFLRLLLLVFDRSFSSSLGVRDPEGLVRDFEFVIL